MDDILTKTFNFGIRVVELSNYLEYENKMFALIHRLLESGTEICVCMRISDALPQYRRKNLLKAFKQASEAEYLLELMVKPALFQKIKANRYYSIAD